MIVHGYFDWIKRCQKRQALFKLGFPVCLERKTVHMLTKKTCTKTYNNTIQQFHEFPDHFSLKDYAMNG